MCEPVSMGIMAAAAVYGAAETQDQQRRAGNRQRQAIESQERAQAEAKTAAERLGPAAKTIDLTKDAAAYEDIKRNKVAMQQGIMGTIKSPSLNAAPVSTIKTTLGT